MQFSFKFLGILTFTVLNFSSVWSQKLLVAPSGPITLGLGTIEDMAFSPDGRYIATASSLGITLWDAQTLNLVKTLYSSTEQVYLRKTLGNSQSYFYYYGCGDSSTSYKWSNGTFHKWPRTIPGRNSEEDQLCIKFSPDGNFITNGIEIWNINDGAVITFDYVEDWLAIESANNRFYVVPTDSVAPNDGVVSTNNGYSYSVESDYNRDDYTSIYTLKIQTVEGESVATIESQVAPRFASSYPMSVHFSPDGKTLGVLWNTPGGKADYLPLDTSAVLYDLTKDGSPLGTLGHHFDWITSVTFSPDNDMIATTRWEAIDLWNVKTGEHLHTLDIPTELVWEAKFSADSGLITTADKDGQILVWQVDTGKLIFNGKSIDDFDNKSAFNFSPSNKFKFRISWDSEPDYIYEDYSEQYLAKVGLYDKEGNLLSEIPHDISVNSVDFSLEGDQLITVGFDGLLLMDAEKQTFIEKLSNYSNNFPSITHAAFTLENSIITFHINGNICLWENPIPYDPYGVGWSSLGKLIPLKHQKKFFDLTTSSDKRTLATRNVDGTVTLFPVGYPEDFEQDSIVYTPCLPDKEEESKEFLK